MQPRLFMAAIVAALLVVPAAVAVADWGSSTSADANVTAAKKAIDAKDWKAAIDILNKAKPSADVYNYLGYAQRNLGNFKEAFANYDRALKLDPQHRGAHEYVGVAYLQTDNLAKAKEHLAALNLICGTGCEEYMDLAREIAAYKKKRS